MKIRLTDPFISNIDCGDHYIHVWINFKKKVFIRINRHGLIHRLYIRVFPVFVWYSRFELKAKDNVRCLLKFIVSKGDKTWNMSVGKYQTIYTIMGFISVTQYSLVRGYPCKKYIVDKWYKVKLG